ncbi:glycosyltransferase [Halanaerobium salsuginis]|uniref:Rhamnosyltransferase n=1 Tax=Halanaerobium salsuginis TaxID=29563 RepID=A0A1I4N1H0_9FIRM|nr:glycosyltransferase [Halanaerobium salsuginis]SFM09371.1 rhamnosyltransferase [Halanaerobium salsuginis]
MVNSNGIACVIILYNPKKEVIQNIKSFSNYVDIIYVVDNSKNINKSIYYKLSQFENLKYINESSNKGIAFPLNLAAKKALKSNYQWLLTMDQDSYFTGDSLKNMISYIKNNDTSKIGIITPHHKINRNNMASKKIETVLTTMTSGNLLNLNIYKLAGDFIEKLFIDSVDHEYCLRLNKFGYKVIKINSSVLNHELGDISKSIDILNKKLLITNHNYLRRYYITRNTLYVINKYKEEFPVFCFKKFVMIILSFFQILFFEKDKFKKIKYIFLGIIDYLNNNFGKIDN